MLRSRKADGVDQWCIATPETPDNDVIADKARNMGMRCFRGSESDVLARFLGAARALDADLVVRVNADSPFVDPYYIRTLVRDAIESQADYSSFESNEGTPAMLTPIGFFTEVITRPCLTKAEKHIRDSRLREHVTLGIYTSRTDYEVRFLPFPGFCDRSDLRFTIDTLGDFELLNEISDHAGEDLVDWPAYKMVSFVTSHPGWLARMAELNEVNRKNGFSNEGRRELKRE